MILFLIASIIITPSLAAQERVPLRPAHTFSIVAVDSATGEIGVAVQSHWFSVGSVVAWAEPGVGAVATQSFVEPAYGPRALYLMRTGMTGPEALAALLEADPDSQVRQVAVIDAAGRVAAHTGSKDIPAAGHEVGRWFSAEANLMRNDRVWPAMAGAFRRTQGDLAERLLAALEAGQEAGGDIRGKQSAALIVVSGDPTRKPWERIFDLRVEDSQEPIHELRRLVKVARAYRAATDGDNFVTAGKIDSALAAYGRAAAILPDEATNGELIFWQAVTLAEIGKTDQSIPYFRRAFGQDASWRILLRRLPSVGLLNVDKATLDRILKEAK